MELPHDILLEIFSYLKISELKKVNLVNKQCNILVTRLLYVFPKLKKKVLSKDLQHFPVQILKLSYISDKFEFSKWHNLHTLILDNKDQYISPNLINNNPNISFLMPISYVYPNSQYHYTNFLSLKNLKLFSTSDCWINIQCLKRLQQFVFHHLCINHLEGNFSLNDLFATLKLLKINRLFFNSDLSILPHMVSLLSKLHITVLSSTVFKNVEFPISILNKIYGLEKVIFEKDTRFVYNELKNVKYLYAYQMYPRQSCKVCGYKEIYQKPLENLLLINGKYATVQEKFILVFQTQKRKWIENFERDYVYEKCVRLFRSPAFSWVNLVHTSRFNWYQQN